MASKLSKKTPAPAPTPAKPAPAVAKAAAPVAKPAAKVAAPPAKAPAPAVKPAAAAPAKPAVATKPAGTAKAGASSVVKASKAGAAEPEWKKALYSPERVTQFVKGEMTLQELHGITGPEMMQMAVQGFTLYENGRYKDAKVVFEGLSSLDPKEAYYLTALGAVCLAENDVDGALVALDAALKLDKKDLAAFVNRGEALLRKGDIAKAAHDFKSAIDLDPKGEDPLTRRAKILAMAVYRSIEEHEQQATAAKAKR